VRPFAVGSRHDSSDQVNSPVRDHIELKLCPRIFAWVLVLIIMGLFQSIAIAQVGPGSSANVQSTKAPKRNGVPPVSAEPTLPRCPAPGVPMPQRSSPTRHHTVTLSWTASLSSVNSEGTAVDYCVYRSQTKNNAEQYATALSTEKENPKCNDCEQVNSIPSLLSKTNRKPGPQGCSESIVLM